MLVKSITVYVLPAAPCVTPSFTFRSRVGQAGVPAGEAGAVAGLVAAGRADGAAAGTVTVTAGAASPLLPQAVARAARQVKAAPVIARRAPRKAEVIVVSFCLAA